ncbi:MAG: glycerophosphodiester phosphodiesterase [Chlorobi bacterium]|nr:glycerophosphodiester phosphodiesterase [Chlorobiota bacterium]
MLNKFGGETYIIAHRGASHEAPENTIPSFELAFKENADFIEGDFRLTKDGKVVCIHDALTKRTAPGQKNFRVSKRTYDELLELDFGLWKREKYTGIKIPTLEEILKIIPRGKGIVIELKEKNIELVRAIKSIIEELNFPLEKIFFISFHTEAILNVIKEIKNAKALWLYDWRYSFRKKKSSKTEQKIISKIKALGCGGIDINATQNLSFSFVEKLRADGFALLTYTIDDLDLALKLFDLGVDGITTNYPGKIRKALAEK